MKKALKMYSVNADWNTGEWLDTPAFCGLVDSAEWHAKPDTQDVHYDTWESTIYDDTGALTADTETRAIAVHFIK